MTTVLVTGGTGLLGPYLVDALASLGKVVPTGLRAGAHPCDLTDPDATRKLVEVVQPDIVIHAAGWTDVDGCERDDRRAISMNVTPISNLAAALPKRTRFLYISTDQVYPDTAGPHGEDQLGPVNVYGRTKLEGERAAEAFENSLALRTNFFGHSRTEGRASLSDFFAARFSRREDTMLFTDSTFSPLHMTTLAELVCELAPSPATGALNIGSRNGMSKADFAINIAEQLGLSTECATQTQSTGNATRAKRTFDLRMDVQRVEMLLGREMPKLEREIGHLLADGTAECGFSA